MPAARALRLLVGAHGHFPPGAPIVGVPGEVVERWVADGAAEYIGGPPVEAMTAAIPETTSMRPAPVRRPSAHPPQRRRA